MRTACPNAVQPQFGSGDAGHVRGAKTHVAMPADARGRPPRVGRRLGRFFLREISIRLARTSSIEA